MLRPFHAVIIFDEFWLVSDDDGNVLSLNLILLTLL